MSHSRPRPLPARCRAGQGLLTSNLGLACPTAPLRVSSGTERAAAPPPRGSGSSARLPGSVLLLRPGPGLEAPRPCFVSAPAATHPLHHQPLGLQALAQLFVFLQGQEEFSF